MEPPLPVGAQPLAPFIWFLVSIWVYRTLHSTHELSRWKGACPIFL
uniref:OCRL inositol polyphosphate-5-phosphatase n=1 Tax=Homo sapiens TaxID=9606 RepID=A0A8I5KYX7_HUMAN